MECWEYTRIVLAHVPLLFIIIFYTRNGNYFQHGIHQQRELIGELYVRFIGCFEMNAKYIFEQNMQNV